LEEDWVDPENGGRRRELSDLENPASSQMSWRGSGGSEKKPLRYPVREDSILSGYFEASDRRRQKAEPLRD